MIELPPIALAVRQPWAWAIIHGGKDIENRVARAVTLGNMKPGRICILASKGLGRDEYIDAADFIRGLGLAVPAPGDLLRGGIIGTVTVTVIVKHHDSPWFFGPRGLVLANPEPCEFIPASGQLGYFKWAPDAAPEPVPVSPWMANWGKPMVATKTRTIHDTRSREPADAPLLSLIDSEPIGAALLVSSTTSGVIPMAKKGKGRGGRC